MKGNDLKKLAIITTHPIQYNAPWFQLLAGGGIIHVKVFYTWSQVEGDEKYDPGFGQNVKWDIPLLEGYEYEFVENISKSPGSKSYKGIDNPGLMSAIEKWNADAVLVFGWKFKSHLKAIRYFHGRLPVLFRGDSHLKDRREGLRNLLRRGLLWSVFRRFDYALYVGVENKKYFEAAGLKRDQLVFIPHAVDNERFRKRTETLEPGLRYREKMNIPQQDFVFLFAGKFESVKNPMLLLHAAAQIQIEGIHFVFAGNGHLENRMKAEKTKNVHFMDFQNQQAMPALYQMCDVYVLPSLSETWGLAVNEAMAAGKPVLVSDACGCVPDLVEEGITGYQFKSGDLLSLKLKLEQIISNSANLNKIGDNALKKIERFSFDKNAQTLESLIHDIVKA